LDYQLINNNFMGVENDVTKKIAQLEENKDVAGLEEVKNDAEAGFDGETVGLAEQAIARLNTKVEKITPPVETTEGQKTQVENMGGSESGLQEVTAPVDEKIAEKDKEIQNVEAETEQKINEVKQQTTEKTSENPELELVKQKQENIEKLEKEMGALLDQALSNLPQQMNEYYNSSEYNKLLELNNKKNQEEKELFEAYEKITKGGDGSHHRSFAIGRGTANYYVDDLKFNNAPKDIIKRFEDFNEKIAKPAFDAEWPLELKSRETITKDKWTFLNALQQKVDETFKGDPKGREEAYKKWSDSYESNYNKIRKETVPDKKEYINTMGTIFS
jgi:chromosome segregation ATPase